MLCAWKVNKVEKEKQFQTLIVTEEITTGTVNCTSSQVTWVTWQSCFVLLTLEMDHSSYLVKYVEDKPIGLLTSTWNDMAKHNCCYLQFVLSVLLLHELWFPCDKHSKGHLANDIEKVFPISFAPFLKLVLLPACLPLLPLPSLCF